MGIKLEVERLEDLLDHADYCSDIYYMPEKIDEGIYRFKIRAGTLVWEGLVKEDSEIYKRLMQVLEIKGVKLIKVWRDEELAERWRE